MRDQPRLRPGLALAALGLLATAARANAGTLYIATAGCHLLVANALLGLVEGRLLRHIWRARAGRATLLMVAANYLSCAVGVAASYGLADALRRFAEGDLLGRVVWAVALGYAVLLAVTILTEWPLVHWSLRGTRCGSTARRSLRVSAIVNSVTAGLIVLLWLPVADASLLRNATIDRSCVAATADDAWVYFIGTDQRLWRVRIDGTRLLRVGSRELPRSTGRGPRRTLLSLCVGRMGLADLRLGGVGAHAEASQLEAVRELTVLVTGISERLPEPLHAWSVRGPERPAALPTCIGLTWEPRDEWRYTTLSVPGDSLGVAAMDPDSDDRVRWLGLLLPPFADCPADSPWLLSSDRVLFQLGPSHIALYDCETRQIGIVAEGSSPVVIADSVAGPSVGR